MSDYKGHTHGEYDDTCPICYLDAEIDRLRAENGRLKAEPTYRIRQEQQEKLDAIRRLCDRASTDRAFDDNVLDCIDDILAGRVADSRAWMWDDSTASNRQASMADFQNIESKLNTVGKVAGAHVPLHDRPREVFVAQGHEPYAEWINLETGEKFTPC